MTWGIKLLLLAAGTVWLGIFTIPDSYLHVIFCDVGQGDATLIIHKNTQLLVDGGPSDEVLKCLEKHIPFWDRTIEMAVVTHKQKDHEFGVKKVAERYNVIVYEPVLKRGQLVKLGDISYRILWPEASMSGVNTHAVGSENNEGIVGIVSYDTFDLLLTADVDLKYYLNLNSIEVVKVPHHGSKYQWEKTWYENLRPALAVISVGHNNYGHPAVELLDGLKDLGVKYLRTDESGAIEIVSDGIKWWVE